MIPIIKKAILFMVFILNLTPFLILIKGAKPPYYLSGIEI